MEPPSIIVEIHATTEPTYTQQVAWAQLWRWLLAPEGHSPVPAVPVRPGLDGAHGPDAPMGHDREVIDGRSG